MIVFRVWDRLSILYDDIDARESLEPHIYYTLRLALFYVGIDYYDHSWTTTRDSCFSTLPGDRILQDHS